MKVKNMMCARLVCALLSLVLCLSAVTVGVGAVAVGDYNNEEERDNLPYYVFDKSLCPHDVMGDEWEVIRYPDGDVPGIYSQKCENCGAPGDDALEIPCLKISTASLLLTDSLAVSFKISKTKMAEGSYTDPYVVFTFRNEVITVTRYTETADHYVFTLQDIAPHMMTEVITAVPYATCYGKVCEGITLEYSVATYCYNMLGKCADDSYAELRTLLVDLLGYGEAAQRYMNNKLDKLATAQLTDAQRAWGTQVNRELTTVQDTKYVERENATVHWKSAGLSLQESVAFRFKIDAANVDGLSMRVVNENGIYTIPSSLFVKTADGYYVYFDNLNASDLSTTTYVTIYDANGPISNTFSYSAESYAYSMKSKSTDEKLINLIDAMMRYGDSAKAYVSDDTVAPEDNWTKPY